MLKKIKNRQPQAGFTLVELLIVIVVIAILAAIAITAFSGVQARARDSQRQADISQVKQSLELYYANEGYYPDTIDLAELEGIEDAAVVAPDLDEANSFIYTGNTTDADDYSYVPAGCNASGECTSYVLAWYSEQDDEAKPVNNVAGN